MRSGQPVLASEQVVLESPTSFTGATKRLWRAWHPRAVMAQGWARAGWLAWLWLLLILAWAGIAVFYAALCSFAISWAVVGPWRVMRRGQRLTERDRLWHAELVAAAGGSGFRPELGGRP